MKNRYFAAVALAGLVSFAACGGGEEGGELGEETLTEDTATMAAPVTPAPVVTDTGAAAGMPGDTGAAAGDTAAH